MTDYIAADWTELSAGNTSSSPNGIQGSYSPSQIAPILREMRGAAKRNFVRSNPIYTTTGTANALVLTYIAGPVSYQKGEIYRSFAHIANTGSVTININGLGAKSLLSYRGEPLAAGQIAVGDVLEFVFDGTSFRLLSYQTHNTNFSGQTYMPGAYLTRQGAEGGELTIQKGTASTLTGDVTFDQVGAMTMRLFDSGNAARIFAFDLSNGSLTGNGQTFWSSGNHGPGSGLNADALDNQQGSFYQNAGNMNAGTLADARLPSTMSGKAFNGATSVNGNFTVAGSLTIAPAGTASIELGRVDGTASTPFLDFHSGATSTDYDSRIIASGGNGTAGNGTIDITAAALKWNGSSIVKQDGGTWSINITGNAGNSAALGGRASGNIWDNAVNAWKLSSDGKNRLHFVNNSRTVLYGEPDASNFAISFGRHGVGDFAHFGADGNLWMAWAGDYLSNLLNAKAPLNRPAFSGSIGVGGVIAGNSFDNGKALAIGDNDTGIRQSGDGVLEFWANNQNRFYISGGSTYSYNDIEVQNGAPRIVFHEPGVKKTWLQLDGGAMRFKNDDGLDTHIFGSDGNIWMRNYGDWLSNILNTKITADGRAYPRRAGGGDINFNWSGQGGQPTWLWGGNDPDNMFVYNPSNFSVAYAGSAGNADTVDGYHASQLVRADNIEGTLTAIGHNSIGTFALLKRTAAGTFNQGDTSNGSALLYTNADGTTYSNSPTGTWRLHGKAVGQVSGTTGVSLWQRIA